MTELDMRKSSWNEGVGVSSGYLLRELYFLGCVVNASPSIEALGVHGLVALRERFQESEVGRMLITVASAIRNAIDQNPGRAEYWMANLTDEVGTLASVANAEITSTLSFREACNKILHSTSVNFDYVGEIRRRGGPLNPTVYLYGEFKGKEWRAALDINAFIDHANELT